MDIYGGSVSYKTKKILYPFGKNLINQYVIVHVKFEEEFSKIIDKSGNKEHYTRRYSKCLRFLINLKENCIMQPNNFEKLLGEKDLYSMRIKGKLNLRALFYFTKINSVDKAILLTIFPEKDKKDYLKYISIANSRIEEINSNC